MNGILFEPVLRHLPRMAVSLYNRFVFFIKESCRRVHPLKACKQGIPPMWKKEVKLHAIHKKKRKNYRGTKTKSVAKWKSNNTRGAEGLNR